MSVITSNHTLSGGTKALATWLMNMVSMAKYLIASRLMLGFCQTLIAFSLFSIVISYISTSIPS